MTDAAGGATQGNDAGRSDERALPFSYSALRREVVRQIPALERSIADEEAATQMHTEPASSYQLVEDFVWRAMKRAAADGPDGLRPYGRLVATMLERGDEGVRTLAVIGLLEQIAHDRSSERCSWPPGALTCSTS